MENPRLVLVAGLPRDAGQVATRLLGPRTAVVHHDLRQAAAGTVRRRLRVGWETDTTTVVDLAHACVSCTLREDVLPTIERLARQVDTIVLHLDPMVEPEPVCRAVRAVMDVHAVITVVDEGSWLADASGDEPVPFAPDDDDRTLAQVAVGQAECADVLVLTGDADRWTSARTAAVLDRLAPDARRVRLDSVTASVLARVRPDAERGEPVDIHGPLLRGQPPLAPDCGVTVTLFRERRPFHPERLHEAIDVLLEGVVRARGRLWVATQPDVALWLESAGGGLRIGEAGAWLAALDDRGWDRAPAHRRAKAALDWHPRFGDRVQEVAVLAHDADPEHLLAVLGRALLTDEELDGDWSALADPFAIAGKDMT
ncbi:ribosome hibernation factor-recruiting GTPase MRF [Actinokineospora fastidiosa]|uniref:Cobalamin synthesis protein n=1 Tax=Actinokineospora fastidiosa TaxID=1816 RepID=A0A918G218_9PSEU|nr:GTP-binding protein [Actinokineospora fastidiosa]GGS15171.1 putative cobalamin synthesis protein [Actinokineospora fastidiosa]